MNLAIIIGLTSVILVLLLGQTRIFYSIARDGLLPPVAAMVHPRIRTPMFRRSSLGVRRERHLPMGTHFPAAR